MITEVSRLFVALGDPSRLKILRALLEAGAPLNQGAVAEATGLSQANASKHLAHLVRVGLVVRETQGNLALFSPATDLAAEVCGLVCGHVSAKARTAFSALN
jgi:DNA-binding transcriptional ArsR family regulator